MLLVYYPKVARRLWSERKAKELMKGLKKGDGFFVDDVMVKGPDNKVRKIAPLGYNITAQ